MAISPFALPEETFLKIAVSEYPGRQSQIQCLTTLLAPSTPSPHNIVVYGSEATGKTAVVTAVLDALSAKHHGLQELIGDIVLGQDTVVRHAVVNCSECITGRHLLESTIASVAKALNWHGTVVRCENLAQLANDIGRMLENQRRHLNADIAELAPEKFVLVFDGIDRQRDSPTTLLSALARLGDIMPSLTTMFIVTSPRPSFLHVSNVPYVHFPAYSKAEAIRILTLSPPMLSSAQIGIETPVSQNQQTSSELWPRFVSVVWDSLSKQSGRDIISLRNVCSRLWPLFTAQIRDGTYTAKDFARIVVSKRSIFQDERVLVPSITSSFTNLHLDNHSTSGSSTLQQSIKSRSGGLATQLPLISRLILIAAYLSSYTPARFDTTLFSRSSTRRKKKGGGTALTRTKPGGGKNRKISRKLLGPQAFLLERMLAIFWTIAEDSNVWRRLSATSNAGLRGNADVQMAIATLASLRLVVKTAGSADILDGGCKLRVNIGWEVIKGVARSVGVEIEDYIVD